MSESETMRHWKSVKGNDPSDLALAMADFAREMEKQRDEARRKAEHLRNCAHGKYGYCHPSAWLPWEIDELEREPSENAGTIND